MTRSSRRMDRIAGRPKWVSTNYTCEECGGKLVQRSKNRFVCTSCGLFQQRKY